VVSVVGIAMLCGVAYYISWSKNQDKPLPRPAAKAAVPAVAPANETADPASRAPTAANASIIATKSADPTG
jgi:hypothetical protein